MTSNITIMVNIVTPRDHYTNKQINKLHVADQMHKRNAA